jgi:hypothetical protein
MDRAYMSEVNEFLELKEACKYYITNGDVGMLIDALFNSMLRRYVKANKDYQLELWKLATAEIMSEQMWDYLCNVIDEDVRSKARACVDDGNEGEEEDDYVPLHF